MKTNFEFLTKDIDTANLFDIAKNVEELYARGLFSNEFESIRKIIENIARQILDLNYIQMPERSTFIDCLRQIKYEKLVPEDILDSFHRLRVIGNSAAHTLKKQSKSEGLEGLTKMYQILAWYMNNYTDVKVDPNDFSEPQLDTSLYNTAERKLIYIQTGDNSSGGYPAYIGSEKIGDATIDDLEIDNRPNSDDLNQAAKHRINQYMKTAGVPYILQWTELAYNKQQHRWFRDYDVHEVLTRSGIQKKELGEGNEWFETDLETAKKAIKAVKEGRKSIDDLGTEDQTKIVLRPEQAEAVKKTKQAFAKYNQMLWNAKMRFGETLSALQLIKDQKYQHVLIMTHRPVVDDGWFEDFKKIGMPEEGYLYGSKHKGESFENLKLANHPFVYFASLQDLRGSELVGGKAGDKNQELFHTTWDLVIIDEAHEGTQTDLAQRVMDSVITPDHTKLLELSGTPFNILDQYDDDTTYTWDYVMEQQAKQDWSKDHPNQPNPYETLPKVSMFTFEMSQKFKDAQFKSDDAKSFNFKEFFRVNDNGSFVYDDKVRRFLDNITTKDERTNYPFSTEQFRNDLRHTLWILPGIKEAKALKALMDDHQVFGREYKVINIVDHDDDMATENDVERVNQAITDHPEKTRTITLTVRKLTTGVTIKPWTGVVFLSNTNSAMQYLQAAFRAQTPYSSEGFGQKTNCYIFDFAPDRALTVMAESAQLNTGVGKRTGAQQKERMGQLLNFLPIIGETDQRMKPFEVDTLLAKLKRVYAEKAVRTGFDDDSLYNDELLMLDDVDLQDFNNLKAVVGSTKSEKKPMQVDVNSQGLTDEEYDQANRAQKKPRKERTPEEQAAWDKMNELKKQQKTMISILRSISIRIPMMIYGMDVELSEEVNIRKFIDNVDAKSWEEFMPKGVSKELFRKFSKYYDEDVFIEAGKIIRQRVKALDQADLIERTKQLALIFGTFRNPDKETVLTPWRVVNLQLGKTLGGLSFYDDDYQYPTTDGVDATHWIETDYTDQIFNQRSRILEINAKTGLYPLYAAISIYYPAYLKLNEQTGGKFGLEDERLLWQQILRENIFVIAKTPMAKTIAERTLGGYQDYQMNVEYIENIVEDTKTDVQAEAQKIKEVFNTMKFDVAIGNPPYQDESKGDNDNYRTPIYNQFMDLSYSLSDLSVLITPARFLFNAGSTPKDWNRKMLNDDHLNVVYYVANSSDVFPRTDIKGGVVITTHDKSTKFTSINELYSPAGIYIPFKRLMEILHKVSDNSKIVGLDTIIFSPENYKFTSKMHDDNPSAESRLSAGHKYDLKSNAFDKLDDIFYEKKPKDGYEYLKIYGLSKKKRTYRYIRKDYISNKTNLMGWKVFVPKANGSGSLGETLSTPMIGNTQTFISIGNFESDTEALNTMKYIKTKFARVMLGILKVTQDNTASSWKLVPLQDFTSNSDIDWTKSISEIDQQLYKKYGLSDDEINFIETKVQSME